MIAYLQRQQHTLGLLGQQLSTGQRGGYTNPRLIDGDCHGAPIEMLARHDALPYLAQSLDAPVERLGPGAPQRPVWFCEVRSDPRHPDLTDAQWADVARRMVAATGIAPAGDPDACRWIALRNQDRQVVVVATRVREDGRVHDPYRDAFRLQTECQRIAADLGHLPPSLPPTPLVQEPSVPITVTITAEPSGSVVARGGDSFAYSLLDHAGFAFTNDWHGPRHRLPTSMDRGEQTAIATHAAEMLRTARYSVDLDPALDPARTTTPANPLGPYTAGAELLRLTDQIRSAENSVELRHAVDHLLHPDHGALERVREALEAAGEQITDLDDEAYQLSDRFGFAAEFVSAAQSELVDSEAELLGVGGPAQSHIVTRTQPPSAFPAPHSAALAASPAAAKARTSSALGTGAADAGASVRPTQFPSPRTR
ncbi:hypothetical protein [Streptacidiphilus sp. P02-A3a]|uniref:hypothetical protein n=1 Tax=Streptacidiphilus sp. P02-A3a TaxID=2704468 RepID=UPI001CDD2B78|nr:hypothetical protein [Streptacidiphilus sp. P02-A3a]